jgi:hypothetical protein
MAKKRIAEYVFRAGLSKDDNLFPKAYALIQANIDFIIAEEIAYINYNIENNVSPYTGFQYDSSTCVRDVGYYLNAYLHDLRYGGNIETRNVSNYLWIDNLPQIGELALDPVLATHAFIKTLISDYVLTNTIPDIRYQLITSQVTIIGQDAEEGAQSRISDLIDIITGVISGGTPAIPAAVAGVGQIRLQGKYTPAELLLITNASLNEIIYNFTDSLLGGEFSYKAGKSSGGGQSGGLSDLDFPRYLQTSDSITSINLTVDTSAATSTDDIQIFVEDDVTTIRPWDFGTDAIERIRVSTPQAMLDADFEYGLQPTKWQAISLQRGYPSVYEIPGSDTSVISIITDASEPTGGVGNSLITVRSNGPHGFTVGQPITIKGLSTSVTGVGRAEGSFLITKVPSDLTFTYYAQAKVGISNGQELSSGSTQLRQASFYTGAAIGNPTISVFSNGASTTINSVGITPAGSSSIAFIGDAPTVGAPTVGGAIPLGAQVTGVLGTGGIVATKTAETSVSSGSTSIVLSDTTLIVEGMALDNGSGTTLFINNISGNILTLSDNLTASIRGNIQSYLGVAGSNIESVGINATFNVSLSGGDYVVVPNAEGTSYKLGDRINLIGTTVGGLTPANDVTLTVTNIGASEGIVESVTLTDPGTGYSDDTDVPTTTSGSGTGFTVNITQTAGVIDTATTSNPGLGYEVDDIITITGGNSDAIITILTVSAGGRITSVTASGAGVSVNGIYSEISSTSTTSVDGGNFNITVTREDGSGEYSIDVIIAGTGYLADETLTFAGTLLGGASPDNDLIVTVDTVDELGGISTFSLAGSGITGDQSFVGVIGLNLSPSGINALFSIQRNNGDYVSLSFTSGSNYSENIGILVLGTSLGGTSPTNDATITVNSVTAGGAIDSISITGTAIAGEPIDIYSAIEISESLTASLDAGTEIDSGAIPTLQASFVTNHGLLPGSGLLLNITSNPAPAISSIGTVVLPSSGTWSGITYSNGRYVAIRSGSSSAAVSINLESWSVGTMATSTTWTSVASGLVNDVVYYVAVASGGTVANYSTTGTTWTASTLPSSGTWTSVTYANGVFVAVRSGSTATARSTNGGVTWSAGGALSVSTTWTDVTGGIINENNIVIAIASGGTVVNYSIDDGVTWAATGVLPSSGTWSSVTYGNFRFVAVRSGSNATAYSTNGLTWTTGGTLPSSSTWSAVEFGNDVFITIASGTSTIASSYDGITWTLLNLTSTSNWNSLASGTIGPSNVWAAVGNNTNSQAITVVRNNHDVAAGPFLVSEVPNKTTVRWVARAQLSIDTSVSSLTGEVYARPDSFFVHRPYDGGVQLGTGSPQHGAQAVRQSKKYIRYQSGKGIMFTTGALFAPSYDLVSGTAESTIINSLITFTTDDTDHGLQVGGIIEVSGFQTAGYNGTFIVNSIINERSFDVRSNRSLTTTEAILGDNPKMSVKSWHGATVRSGPFDDQNGLFYQYDGQYLSLCKRSSTFQIAGSVSVNVDSNLVTGVNTRFTNQLKVGDRVVLKGMSHVITDVVSDTELTFNPDYRGVSNAVSAKMCLTADLIIPQTEWNLDRADGTGPSGYSIDVTKMQMIGIQYTWYAAGFVEFMLRGADGRFIFLHRIRNSNVNTEAYMRTANLPVRYEVINESAKDSLAAAMDESQTTILLYDAFYFPTAGVVYIDNELISFTGKSGNTLTGCVRSAGYQNFASGANRTYTAGPAAAHSTNTGVILISTTITPVISHWGSALLTDGRFDEDRGYLFTYASTGNTVSTTKKTAFLLRLAPSVSNALVGDLGERELLNRAQLLLREIAVSSDAVATNTGGIVIEGVLNPQNYPVDPGDIAWGGISGVAQGGQPSFVQIAPGGSVNWNSGAVQTTASATTSSTVSLTNRNFLYFTAASWEAIGAIVGTEIAASDTKFPAGTRVTQVFGPANYVGSSPGNEYVVYFSQSSNTTIAGGATVAFSFGQPPYALPGETVFSFIANPGETNSLILTELKELTNTTLGGRGTYPNGPDVLAINIYKTAGTSTVANLILRWGEAQA